MADPVAAVQGCGHPRWRFPHTQGADAEEDYLRGKSPHLPPASRGLGTGRGHGALLETSVA